MTPNQQQQKDRAREEAEHHVNNSNVTGVRGEQPDDYGVVNRMLPESEYENKVKGGMKRDPETENMYREMGEGRARGK